MRNQCKIFLIMLEDHLSISDAELVLVRLLILEAGSRVLDLSLALADVEVVWNAFDGGDAPRFSKFREGALRTFGWDCC